MKIIVGISRIFVGVLFIISGLIKLNDPVGFSFKLQDYFAPEVLNLGFLVPFALALAVFVVIYEVLLGVMIILGHAKKFTLWSLLLMIVFFTFLTFYSAYFNKVTDCGCFGDALPLTPWESFYKDVVLLVLILILYFGRKYIEPFFSKMTRRVILILTLIFCVWFGYHVLNHLPSKDFRAYKIGVNIPEGMSVPEDAPKPIFEYDWKFNVNGSEKIVTTNGDYPNQEGEFLGVETREIQAGYEPPIHDFSIERNETDYTTVMMEEEHLIVVIVYSLSDSEPEGFPIMKEVTDRALENGYKVIGMSASTSETMDALCEEYGLNFKFYFCDMTTLKTIVRSNPGILELQRGTIMQKLHWNDADQLQLEKVGEPIQPIDEVLKRQLDSIAVLDQRFREFLYTPMDERADKAADLGLDLTDFSDGAMWFQQTQIDSTNMLFVEKIFNEKGYPGKSVVGEDSQTAAWYVLQHNPDRIAEFLPMIKKAGAYEEVPMRLVAMMEDRYLMNKGEAQIYGTQGMSYQDERGDFIWPIADPETVNERRAAVGFEETVETYAKGLFGEDFEYKVLTLEDVKQ